MSRKSIDWLEHHLLKEEHRLAQSGIVSIGSEHYRIIDARLCRMLTDKCLTQAIGNFRRVDFTSENARAIACLESERERRLRPNAVKDLAVTGFVMLIVATLAVVLMLKGSRGAFG